MENQTNQTDAQILAPIMARIARCFGTVAVRLSVSRKENDKARIIFLEKMGFDTQDIAAILRTTPGSVSVAKSKHKKKKSLKKKKRKKP